MSDLSKKFHIILVHCKFRNEYCNLIWELFRFHSNPSNTDFCKPRFPYPSFCLYFSSFISNNDL